MPAKTHLIQKPQQRPLFWGALAFILLVVTATVLSIGWQVLLVQHQRIAEQLAQVASKSTEFGKIPFVFLIVMGALCSSVFLLGLIFLFLRLIQSIQLNLAQSQFISTVTHELRSPVASMQLLFETLRNPNLPQAKKEEFEKAMAADLRRLHETVDLVLEAARLENFFKRAHCETVSIQESFEDLLTDYKHRIQSRGGKFHVEGLDPSTRVGINKRLFKLAMANVFDNALKYSYDIPEITLRTFNTGKRVHITVTDQGIGIAPENLKKIFRRFYRAGDALTQERPGTGLGLYFARLALLAQGGNIYVQSPGLGKGSTFEIELEKK